MSKEHDPPEYVMFEGQQVKLASVLEDYRRLRDTQQPTEKELRAVLRKNRQNQELKPYQAELIQMQNYLMAEKLRMIIIFEGRDAAGKGGTIRPCDTLHE